MANRACKREPGSSASIPRLHDALDDRLARLIRLVGVLILRLRLRPGRPVWLRDNRNLWLGPDRGKQLDLGFLVPRQESPAMRNLKRVWQSSQHNAEESPDSVLVRTLLAELLPRQSQRLPSHECRVQKEKRLARNCRDLTLAGHKRLIDRVEWLKRARRDSPE